MSASIWTKSCTLIQFKEFNKKDKKKKNNFYIHFIAQKIKVDRIWYARMAIGYSIIT